MTEQVANTVTGNLNGAIDAVVTSVTLVSAAAFPGSGNFRLKVDDELMLVTGVAGAVLTVTRGIESTVAAAHVDGRAAKMVHTAAALTTIISEAGGGGGELAYAEAAAADQTITATSEATAQLVVAAPAVVFDGVTPVVLDFGASSVDCPQGASTLFCIYMDGAPLVLTNSWAQVSPVVGVTQERWPVTLRRRLIPTAGSHTFAAHCWVTGATATVRASANYTPVYISIRTA